MTAKVKYKRTEWVAFKGGFFAQRLAGGKLSLKEFAHQRGVDYSTARNRSSKEGWMEELREKIAARDSLLAEKMEASGEQAINSLQQRLGDSIADVRARNAIVAKGLLSKVVKRLQSVPIESMSVRDCAMLYSILAKEERLARGIPETVVPTNERDHIDAYLSKAHEAFHQRLMSKTRVKEALARMIQVIEGDYIKVLPNASNDTAKN